MYKNVSWARYKTLLLTEKIMRNYSGFYQDLSGYYMVFMNYIAITLTLPRKIIFLQFVSDCDVKTRLSRPNFSSEKFSPSTHSVIYYNQKAKRRVFFEAAVTGCSKVFLLKIDVLFYIIFSKRRCSHLTISLRCFNKFKQNW